MLAGLDVRGVVIVVQGAVCASLWRVERDSVAVGPQEQVVQCAAVPTCRVVVDGVIYPMCAVCGNAAVTHLGGVMVTAEVEAQAEKMRDRAALVRSWADEVAPMVPEVADYFRHVADGCESFVLNVYQCAYRHQQPGA